MTKAEFIEKFAAETGFSKKDAAKAVNAFFDVTAAALTVNAFFDVTAAALRKGDKVVFPGAFKAEVVERKARTGRNPLTGAEMKIPAKKVIKAKLSDKLL